MEDNPVVIPLLTTLTVLALLAIASRFLARYEAGEDMSGPLNAVGDELNKRGIGRGPYD